MDWHLSAEIPTKPSENMHQCTADAEEVLTWMTTLCFSKAPDLVCWLFSILAYKPNDEEHRKFCGLMRYGFPQGLNQTLKMTFSGPKKETN